MDDRGYGGTDWQHPRKRGSDRRRDNKGQDKGRGKGSGKSEHYRQTQDVVYGWDTYTATTNQPSVGSTESRDTQRSSPQHDAREHRGGGRFGGPRNQEAGGARKEGGVRNQEVRLANRRFGKLTAEVGADEPASGKSGLVDAKGPIKALIEFSSMERIRHGEEEQRLAVTLSHLHCHLLSADLSITSSELSDIAFALGKLKRSDTDVMAILRKIAKLAKWRVEQFSPHDIAGILWGFASLSQREEEMMSVIAAEVVNKIHGFDQRQLANTAWAFATCSLWNLQLANTISDECLGKMPSFTAHSLSHLVWAMAHWGTERQDLLTAIAEETEAKVTEFGPGPLAMTAWSFANLQYKSLTLMSALSKQALGQISTFKTQDLAHFARAFANIRVQDQALFDRMAEMIRGKIKEASPSELANVSWAFSKNNASSEQLMSVIAKEALTQMPNFTPAEVAMLTWAFAVTGLQNKALMSEIGATVVFRIDAFTPPQLSHIAWAFGVLALRYSEFFEKLSSYIHLNLTTFRGPELSNIAWAFGMVLFRDVSMFTTIAPEIAKCVTEMKPIALSRCAWAYQVLRVQHIELMNCLALEALNKVGDTPTKVLIKQIDAQYSNPSIADEGSLWNCLETTISEVSNFLVSTWSGWEALGLVSREDYNSAMNNFSFYEAGVVGTPILLSLLDIGLPSRGFMNQCRDKAWTKHTSSQERGQQDSNSSKKYSVAEIKITWSESGQCDRAVNEWVKCNAEDPWNLKDNCLVAVQLPGCLGFQDPTVCVLETICTRIFALGVAPGSMEACASVEGTVQLLSTTNPCISSVGALRQFEVRFPKVVLEFVEQVGEVNEHDAEQAAEG